MILVGINWLVQRSLVQKKESSEQIEKFDDYFSRAINFLERAISGPNDTKLNRNINAFMIASIL